MGNRNCCGLEGGEKGRSQCEVEDKDLANRWKLQAIDEERVRNSDKLDDEGSAEDRIMR